MLVEASRSSLSQQARACAAFFARFWLVGGAFTIQEMVVFLNTGRMSVCMCMSFFFRVFSQSTRRKKVEEKRPGSLVGIQNSHESIVPTGSRAFSFFHRFFHRSARGSAPSEEVPLGAGQALLALSISHHFMRPGIRRIGVDRRGSRSHDLARCVRCVRRGEDAMFGEGLWGPADIPVVSE